MKPILALSLFVLTAAPARAQHDHDHMNMEGMEHEAMPMRGALGGYPNTRDASGTSWQPESTPHEGLHRMGPGDTWMFMAHGYALGVYDYQGGKRDGSQGFSASMLMLMAQRVSAGGNMLTLRAMTSLDPAMGPRGYRELLQTGETADGKTLLIDRQHPHDLFMELSGSYSWSIGENRSIYLYAGLPGEPALGPPAFMHRYSGVDDPQAPISHHWLDSTHITYGVTTLGLVLDRWKLEGSAFKGREPDEERWDIEEPKLDSYSGRLSYNPTDDWSLQASYGRLNDVEALKPGEDVSRLTASASNNWEFMGTKGQSTFAYGRNTEGGHSSDAFLIETAGRKGKNTAFDRLERVEKHDLGATVHRLSLGFTHDIGEAAHTRMSVGAAGSVNFIPSSLKSAYGSLPLSLFLFVRLKLV